MSQNKTDIVQEHGRRLSEFPDQSTAERELLKRRDLLIQELIEASRQSDLFRADFSPESLQGLEKWYFKLWEEDAFRAVGLDRERFERCMAMYKGEVMVRNAAGFRWFVQEYAFLPGRFEIGVRKGLVSIMLNGEKDLYQRADNKRQQSMWREYRRWTGL